MRPKQVPNLPCVVDECDAPQRYLNGYCMKHYRRWKDHGDPLILKRKLNGEGSISSQGYVKVYNKTKGKAVAQHRLVIEQIIGRDLLPEESVHHKNGIRSDNRPENLELWSKSHPSGQRIEDLYQWATEIVEKYGSIIECNRLSSHGAND